MPPESEVIMRLANEVRPHTFDEMVGQKEIVANIRQQSIQNKFFQGYTLCGQFGSGKTTIARIIQLAVNCHHKDEGGNPCLVCDNCKAVLAGASGDIVEIDAASNTGVDAIRTLKEEVQFMPSMLDKKVYIIDEVQRLSAGAFDALLKVLEEPPAHVIFVLCTTEKNKIPKTILSRTAVYNFGCICSDDIVTHLAKVCENYDISYDKEGLVLIARNSQGAMRNALSMLEQISNAGEVTEKSVAQMLGVADAKKIVSVLDSMLDTDEKQTIGKVMEMLDGGIEPFSMISDMLDMLADCIVISYGGSVSGTQEYKEYICGLTAKYTPRLFSALIKELLGLREKYREMPDRSTVVCGLIAAFHGVDLLNEVTLLKKAVVETAFTARNIAAVSMQGSKGGLHEKEQILCDDSVSTQEDVVEEKENISESLEMTSQEAIESEYPFPVQSVVVMDGRKFRVEEYRMINDLRTDVVLFDLTAAEECGYPISRQELLSVFRIKAKPYTETETTEEKRNSMQPAEESNSSSVSATVKESMEDVPKDDMGAFYDSVFGDADQDEVPFKEDKVSASSSKENNATDGDIDLFAMFGIGGQESLVEAETDGDSLTEELEKSTLLKTVVDFSCDVDADGIHCREKKEEPMGRILNAFAGAGKLTAAVNYAL